MNKKKVLLFSLAAIVSSSAIMAQGWKLTGNSLTTSGKLGSTNAQDVNFISDNLTRMSLTKTGDLKIASDQTAIQFPNPGSAPRPMMFIYQSGSANTSRMLFAYSSTFPNFGLQYTLGDKMDFVGSGVSAFDIDLVNKRIGTGTTVPKTKLHVVNGSSGATPTLNTTFTLENSTHNYINMLTPNSSESGILFGNTANNASGGIIYNSSFFGSAPNALQFRTNGNVPRMVITSEGKLGIGPSLDPTIYRLRVDHANAFGFDIANSNSGTDWEFLASTSGLNLFADGQGQAKGVFNRTTGVYSSQSDERVKMNIKPMSDVLEKISQLKPSSYQFKNVKDRQQYDGFIAQQVMKVFPNLVEHNIEKDRNMDLYMLNYSGFGVIAIKGIQEMMKKDEEKNAKIEALQKQIDELKAMILSRNTPGQLTINSQLSNASIEQNTPNPFNNTTAIRYTLPQKFTSAQIIVTDKSGNTLKKVNISGGDKGVATIDASSLISGTYNYSLIADGKLISTKQMIVTK